MLHLFILWNIIMLAISQSCYGQAETFSCYNCTSSIDGQCGSDIEGTDQLYVMKDCYRRVYIYYWKVKYIIPILSCSKSLTHIEDQTIVERNCITTFYPDEESCSVINFVTGSGFKLGNFYTHSASAQWMTLLGLFFRKLCLSW